MNLHPAEKYARDAAAGRIVVSRWVRLAAERHLSDLREGRRRGLHFDTSKAQHALGFYSFVKHRDGEWAGQEVRLEPWQQFIIWVLFGWRNADGSRRFRVAHVEVARKNGKSTMLAPIGLYCAFFEGEPGAQVYCAATKKDQARIVYAQAEWMRTKSPALSKRITKFRDNMHIPETGCKFEPLGADEDTLDGLNVYAAIVDELHKHKSRGLWDVLDTATGARRQALLFAITTAGFDRASICWQQREYGTRILEGIIQDDTFFPFVACLDDGDDWEDEACWAKANPNLGVSVKLEDMRRQAHKAKNDPSALNSFLNQRLNVWTAAESAAINPEAWRACVGYSLAGIDAKVLRGRLEEELLGRRCFIGVDLSSTQDVTAAVKLFPPLEESEPYIVIPHFWIPEDNLHARMAEHRAPYDVWAREQFLLTTEGNVVDYDAVKARILEDLEKYDVVEIAFDPWNATQFANDLQKDGVDAARLVTFKQTIEHFAGPTKHLIEVLVGGKKLAHLGNPVLSWMAANLHVWADGNGNIRPTKKSSPAKIDGMVALIMALGRAMASTDSGGSVYESRGVLTF